MGQTGGIARKARWQFPTTEEAVGIFREFGYWNEEADPDLENLDVLTPMSAHVLNVHGLMYGYDLEIQVDGDEHSCSAVKVDDGRVIQKCGGGDGSIESCIVKVLVNLIHRTGTNR